VASHVGGIASDEVAALSASVPVPIRRLVGLVRISALLPGASANALFIVSPRQLAALRDGDYVEGGRAPGGAGC